MKQKQAAKNKEAMSAPEPASTSGIPLALDPLSPITHTADHLVHSVSGGSISGSSIDIVLFMIIFIIAIVICYFKAARGCKNSRRQTTFVPNPDPDQDTLDATVDRFLNNMAKEKPHRYTSEQLAYCTRSYFQRLGSGGFGVVYKGLLPEGVPVAVKVLNNNLTKQVEEQFMAEVNSIGRTYHLHLVKLYGYCFEPKLKALVYEFMPNGSLDRLLFSEIRPNSGFQLNWPKLHSIAVGTAKGIAYLHEECHQKIIHHDIKPGNVLLDSGLNPKVADFGLARLSNRDSTHVVMSGFKGTPGYAAPEVWTSYVTHKCDVYSFGMMLLEMVGRRRNHLVELSGTSKEWLPRWTYQKLRDGRVAELLGEFGVAEAAGETAERAVKVALWCVQYSPAARPEMSAVVKMLEGGMEVPPPPNPFAYLDQTFDFDVNGMGSRNGTGTPASSSGNGEIEKCASFPQVEETRIDVDFKSF